MTKQALKFGVVLILVLSGDYTYTCCVRYLCHSQPFFFIFLLNNNIIQLKKRGQSTLYASAMPIGRLHLLKQEELNLIA